MRESIKLCLHITRRNWMVYRKELLANTSPTVADPALIMISLGFGLGPFLTNINGMTYMKFLAPGLTIATALFTSFFETSWGFYIRMSYENVYKAMLTTPIGAREVIWGEFLWVGLKGGAMGFGVAVVLSLFGLMANPFLLPATFFIGFLVGIGCGALGLISTTFVQNINQFQTVYSFLIAPLYFLSGIFFPIENLLTPVRIFAELFPLIHGVRMAQAIFWDRNILEIFLYSGSVLILQCFIYGWIAYGRMYKKLIA